jgi:hypothetical protein
MAIVSLIGCNAPNYPLPMSKAAKFEVYVVTEDPTPETKEAVHSSTNKKLLLVEPPVITGADVKTLQLDDHDPSSPTICLNLTTAGEARIAEKIVELKGKGNKFGTTFAAVVNGDVVSLRTLRGFHPPYTISTREAAKRDELFYYLSD